MVAIRETTSVKLDREVKEEAKKIFRELGLTMGDAFNIFLHQVILNRGLPFEVKVPNSDSAKAMLETRDGVNIENLSLEELKGEFKKA